LQSIGETEDNQLTSIFFENFQIEAEEHIEYEQTIMDSFFQKSKSQENFETEDLLFDCLREGSRDEEESEDTNGKNDSLFYQFLECN